MVAGALPSVGAAQAHGTVINPATRAYQCWKTWGNQHTNPAMQQQDPMCYRAFQANPDTMWNWMSQLRDGLGGQFQARTPDGQLCSNATVSVDADHVRPGVVATTKGHWLKLTGGAGVNATVDERDSDMGGGAVFHDNRVQIEPVAPGDVEPS